MLNEICRKRPKRKCLNLRYSGGEHVIGAPVLKSSYARQLLTELHSAQSRQKEKGDEIHVQGKLKKEH